MWCPHNCRVPHYHQHSRDEARQGYLGYMIPEYVFSDDDWFAFFADEVAA